MQVKVQTSLRRPKRQAHSDLFLEHGGASPSLSEMKQPREEETNHVVIEGTKAATHLSANGGSEGAGKGQLYAPTIAARPQKGLALRARRRPDNQGSSKGVLGFRTATAKTESESERGDSTEEEDSSEKADHKKIFSAPQNRSGGSPFDSMSTPSRELQVDQGRKERENGRGDHSQIWVKGKTVLEASKGVAADFRLSLFQLKDRLIEKLAAIPIPADSLDNARQSMESIIKEATQAAYGRTKDAVQRIRLLLVEILPSLSPSETREIVDDVEREVLDMSEAGNGESSSEKVGILTATTSALSPRQSEGLVNSSLFSMNMSRIRSWTFRSRL